MKITLNFLTLTLPAKQIYSDQLVKRYCLNRFLRALKYIKPNINYIWRCEKQENGNIHFHVTLDKYIFWGGMIH